jgi:uncharacterized protein YecT (DUF1311 family)
MLTKIMGMLLCVFLLVSSAWADLNSPDMSDEEYRQYLGESLDFRTADKNMNYIYNQLMSVLDESGKNDLREDQKKWVIKRDNEAFSEAPKGVDVYFNSLIKLTQERKSELESRLLKFKENSVNSKVLPTTPPPVGNQNTQQQAEPPVNNRKESEPSGIGDYSFIIMMGILIFIIYFVTRKKKMPEGYITHISDFTETQKIMGVNGLVGLAIDEQRKKICLINYPQKQFRVISYQDLLSSEIFEDGASISKTMRGSQIAGAIIGNIAFGGVGAIIGGLSGKRKTTGTVNRIDFRLTVNDIKQPIFDINFLNKETQKDKPIYQEALQKARHCHGLVEVLIKRADMEDRQQDQKINTSNVQQVSQQTSVADELKKLADLRDSGALTAEEFQQQKRKLLG